MQMKIKIYQNKCQTNFCDILSKKQKRKFAAKAKVIFILNKNLSTFMGESFITVIGNYTNFTVYDFLFMFECLFTFSTTLREGKVIRHSAIMHFKFKLCFCRTF